MFATSGSDVAATSRMPAPFAAGEQSPRGSRRGGWPMDRTKASLPERPPSEPGARLCLASNADGAHRLLAELNAVPSMTTLRTERSVNGPERLRPGETRPTLTDSMAASFASVAHALRDRGHHPQAVAHFVNFCMFADDVGLLADDKFTRMLPHALPAPTRFREPAAKLFRAMASGGRVAPETVSWSARRVRVDQPQASTAAAETAHGVHAPRRGCTRQAPCFDICLSVTHLSTLN